MKKFKGEICLAIASLIWGTAFIFQKMGMDYIGPFTFGFFRFTIGALALLPVIYIFSAVNKKRDEPREITPFSDKTLINGGLLCGLSCFLASSFQQVGIVYTTAGKAGFITSMDMVLVPVFMIFLRRKVGLFTWLGVAVGCFGMYLLCITEGFTIHIGDGLVFLCAVFYAMQILLIDYYTEKVDPVKLAFYEFMVTGILSLVAALIFETIQLQPVIDCTVPILYTAILEVTIAFTLQMVGQKDTNAAIAVILMSMESVFAALSGWLFLGESMSPREGIGCVVMLTAFILSQVPELRAAKAERLS